MGRRAEVQHAIADDVGCFGIQGDIPGVVDDEGLVPDRQIDFNVSVIGLAQIGLHVLSGIIDNAGRIGIITVQRRRPLGERNAERQYRSARSHHLDEFSGIEAGRCELPDAQYAHEFTLEPCGFLPFALDGDKIGLRLRHTFPFFSQLSRDILPSCACACRIVGDSRKKSPAKSKSLFIITKIIQKPVGLATCRRKRR